MAVATTSRPNLTLRQRWNRIGLGRLLERLRDRRGGRKQRRLVGKLICVTGSCGKSTTVRLIGQLLRGSGTVKVTGHPNTGRNVVRTHRKLRGPVDFVVQEVSAYGPGSLTRIVDALRIDITVVTAVGADHGTSYRKSPLPILDAIALEKGRLAEAVHSEGTVCLNFDDPRVAAMASRCKGKVVTFGTSEGADLRAVSIEAQWPGLLSFDLERNGRTYAVNTRFVGRLMLPNVLGALAAAEAAGVPLETAIERIGQAGPVPQHMSIHQGNDGRTYILDTFKAPFWSTEMLMNDLPVFADTPFAVVLGSMSDMGSNNGAKYRRVVRRAASMAQEVVLTHEAAFYGRNLPSELANVVLLPTIDEVVTHLASSSHQLVLMKSGNYSKLSRAVLPVGIDVPNDDVNA